MDEDGAPLMILEYMQYGDLASFLRTHRYDIACLLDYYLRFGILVCSPVDGKPSLIGEENFRTFAINVRPRAISPFVT